MNHRIASLDTIRGAAVCGILFINAAYFNPVESAVLAPSNEMGALSATFFHAWQILFAGKFFTLFSFLFGAGLQIFLGRAEARNERYVLRYLRRASALFALGLAHSLVWTTDIIGTYVIISLLILPLYKCSLTNLRRLLIVMLVVSTCLPLMPVNSWLLTLPAGAAYKALPFVAGMYAVRSSVFDWLDCHIPLLAKYLPALLAALVFFVGAYIWLVLGGASAARLDAYVSLTSYPMAACYLVILAWMHGTQAFNWLSSKLAILGRMSLTNYLTQDRWGMLLIGCTGLAPLQAQYIPIVAIVIVGIQLGLGLLWLRFFRLGPFELLVNWITYGASRPVTQNRGLMR